MRHMIRRFFVATAAAAIASTAFVAVRAAPEGAPPPREIDCSAYRPCFIELDGGVQARLRCEVRRTSPPAVDGGSLGGANVVAPADGGPPWPVKIAFREFPSAVVGNASVDLDGGTWTAHRGNGGPPSWSAWPNEGVWSISRFRICPNADQHGDIDAVLIPKPSSTTRTSVSLRAFF
jgi:hypothetical protein